MSGEINIYGVLNSATTEGIVAKANQIKDETQNKKQSEINSEYKNRLNNLESNLVTEIELSNIDELSDIEDCGYYIVNTEGHNCGSLIVVSDNQAHGVMQFLSSNYQIDTEGNISAGHTDGTFTIICRYKRLSDSWGKWSYFGINDNVPTSFYSYSSNKIEDKISNFYKVNSFAGIVEDTIMPSSTTGEGTSSTVYFSTVLKCFCIKKSTTYHSRWDNSNLWNDKHDTSSPVAYSNCLYINQNNIYRFNGTTLELLVSGFNDAPSDESSIYGRKNGNWEEIRFSDIATNVGNELLLSFMSAGIYSITVDNAKCYCIVVGDDTNGKSLFLFDKEGAIRRKTKPSGGSWGNWEYYKQEAGDSEKFAMSQKAITNLIGQLQVPVNFNTFISEQIKVEEVGSSGTGTKDNVYYYNYGTYHKFVMLHTDGKYYDQFNGQENWQADFNNPKTNTRFVDITGENYYYNGTELVAMGFGNSPTIIYGKYDDSSSFSETAKKLLLSNFFFAKINVKIGDGQYSQVFFTGNLKKESSDDILHAILVGVSVQGKHYRMISEDNTTVTIEEIV